MPLTSSALLTNSSNSSPRDAVSRRSSVGIMCVYDFDNTGIIDPDVGWYIRELFSVDEDRQISMVMGLQISVSGS